MSIVKKERNKPDKTFEIGKKLVLDNSKRQMGPRPKLDVLVNEILPEKKRNGKAPEDSAELLTDLSRAFSIETGHVLIESVRKDYRDLAIQLKQDIQEEYNCSTSLEKALVDQIVNSYIRKLSCSVRLEGQESYIDSDLIKYRNHLSTEIDRAHRQFLSGLETLKAIKSPKLDIKLKTENAYIAEKQSINAKKQ